jgi:hypothetical protein
MKKVFTLLTIIFINALVFSQDVMQTIQGSITSLTVLSTSYPYYPQPATLAILEVKGKTTGDTTESIYPVRVVDDNGRGKSLLAFTISQYNNDNTNFQITVIKHGTGSTQWYEAIAVSPKNYK